MLHAFPTWTSRWYQQEVRYRVVKIVKDALFTVNSPLLGANSSSAAYTDAPSDAWLPFVSRKTVQLPPALLDELTVVPRSCGMGLLPEIHCAYIAMNNLLYIWDYSAGCVLSQPGHAHTTNLHLQN